MYARLTMLTGVQDIDAAVKFLEESSLSEVRSQRGYQGISAAADRSAGLLGVLTLWETAADRDASESALAKLREQARSQLATGMTTENLEQRVVEISKPPTVGARVLVTRISMDPAKVDENVEFFKSEVLPQIKSAPGFRSLRNLINPQTGEGVVGSIWDDDQSLQAAVQAAQKRREIAAGRGVTFGDQIIGEVVFADQK